MYIRFTMKSKELMRATDVHVFLPYHDGYPNAKAPYKTLYFLPGYSGNATELVFTLPFRQMCALYNIAVVIPDGENSFYTDHPERVTHNGRFVAEELVAATRRLFPCLSQKREDTFIGGISMGGYGSMMLALNWSDTFSKIALLSPAIEVDQVLSGDSQVAGAVDGNLYYSIMGGDAQYHTPRYDPLIAFREKLEHKEAIQPIWLCCGEDDLLVGGSIEHFRSFLTENGIPFHWEAGKGTHDLPYWDAHLESAFRFLAE